MPPTELTIGGPSNKAVKAHRVYTRLDWGDEWDLMSEVHCLQASWVASPSIPEATLYYRYGIGRLPDDEDGLLYVYARFTLPVLVWVKIEFDTFDLADINGDPIIKTWYGIAGSIVDQVDGDQVETTDISPVAKPSGFQTINCAGIEWLLEREYITRATWRQGSTTRTVDSAPAFAKNRITSKVSGSWHFSSELESNNEDWTSRSIVEYLLDRAPSFMTWRVRASALDLIPDWDAPAFEVQGYTISSLLKRVLSRQRGIGFYYEVVPDGGDEVVELVPFTFTSTDVDLGDGNTLDANTRQFELTLAGDHTGDLVLITDAFAQYHSVKVTGARATSCFTVSVDSDTLSRNWTTSRESDFIDGASTQGGYPPITEMDLRRVANEKWRSQQYLEGVFTDFFINGFNISFTGVSPPWGYETYSGDVATPKLDADLTGLAVQSFLEAEYTYLLDKKILPYIPVYRNGDYTTDPFTLPHPAIREKDFISPSVFFLRDSVWYRGSEISFYGTFPNHEGFDFTATVRPNPGRPLSFFLVVDGQKKEVVATWAGSDLRNFTRVDGWDWQVHEWDYRTALFTVAIELDHYCEVQVDDTEPPASDIERVKLINVGDKYRLDRAAVDTVIGTSQGALVKLDSGKYLQDDRPELELIAKRALSWYGTPRQAARWSTSWVNGSIGVGDLITAIVDAVDTHAIESPITDVVINIPIAAGSLDIPPLKMAYQTSFTELDVF